MARQFHSDRERPHANPRLSQQRRRHAGQDCRRRPAHAKHLSPTNALPCGGRSLPTGNVMSSTRFTLHLADLDWQVLAFEAVEAIGRPTRISLELVSSRADLELNGLLRQPARLTLDEGRALHGLVWGSEQTHCTPRSEER